MLHRSVSTWPQTARKCKPPQYVNGTANICEQTYVVHSSELMLSFLYKRLAGVCGDVEQFLVLFG